jgi:acetylornithine deacetylase/succinyl-diaminopimelate desuccinylase-like protein
MGLRNIPTVGYGPGDDAQSHQVGERLDLAQLHQAVDGYSQLARGLAELVAAEDGRPL